MQHQKKKKQVMEREPMFIKGQKKLIETSKVQSSVKFADKK